MCADLNNANSEPYLPAQVEIRSATDEFMANLPGVTRVTIRCQPGETLMIQEITLAPGAMIPLHYHMKRREMYFWESGEGVLIKDGQEYSFCEAGIKQAFIRRQVVHGLRNDSSEPFKFKVMYNALCEDCTQCVFGDTYLD